MPFFDEHMADIPNETPVYNYTLDGASVGKEPEVPLPYRTFSEVAPGYGI